MLKAGCLQLVGGANDTQQLFNWHPLMNTLGFAVFMAEAVLAYQAPVTELDR